LTLTLTQDAVRELAGFKAGDAPVVSLYLDVDGRKYPRSHDYELQLEHLVRSVNGGANGVSTGADLRRIETFVKAGVDRSEVRGLAIFSSAGAGLWRVIPLPVPVRNQITVNQSPQVRQLEALLDEYERFGVLLVDRQRTRLFVFELGQLVDRSEQLEQLPRHEDEGGVERDHVRDHVAAHAHQHLRRAAQLAFHVHQQQALDHLVICAPDEVRPELERELHSYLRDRIAARLALPASAREDDIRQAALAVEEQLRRDRHAALIARLRDAVGAGGPEWVSSGAANGRLGVAGLENVLGALGEKRVETLLVSEDFDGPGWECRSCGALAAVGRSCRQCGADMEALDDVVEAAVDQAVLQKCRVVVFAGNADLDVMGRIGALLRF
jgi:peptide chain release factor subunit 1